VAHFRYDAEKRRIVALPTKGEKEEEKEKQRNRNGPPCYFAFIYFFFLPFFRVFFLFPFSLCFVLSSIR